MNLEKFYIPRHLDDAPRFLLWSVDEAMSFMMPVVIGMVANFGIFGPILGIICAKKWKKVKGVGGANLLKAIVYWHYPRDILGLKFTPDASIKNYIA